MIPRTRHHRWTSLALGATGLALALAGCGDSEDRAEGAAGDDSEPVEYVEPEYDGLPTDLTSEEVCDLLDDATAAEHLQAEVTQRKPGTSQPDCTWYYKLPSGPATTLHVQVMSMQQTDERLGTEALQWALDVVPDDVDVTESDELGVPNASYEFGASTVVLTIDPVGRLVTVAAHAEVGDQDRLALVSEVLSALGSDHA